MADLTRKEFYQLAGECRDYAMRLANYDPNAVNGTLCREFNLFRDRMLGYDQLHDTVLRLKPARPLTRGLVMAVVLAIWLLIVVITLRLLTQISGMLTLSLTLVVMLGSFIVPPALYGTSVEAIEGRVLAVVDRMLEMLEAGDLGFTEAAFFQVRDMLREANSELRQQVYLNRKQSWR